MKFKTLDLLYFLVLFLCNGTFHSEGFSATTLISTPKGLIPIEQLLINDLLESWSHTKKCIYPLTHKYHYTSNKYVKITIANLIICTAPDQQFYSIIRNRWIQANKLKPLEILMCANKKTVLI